MSDRSQTMKGILLVAGTSIGGGMLALPVLTCLAGFVPSLVVYLVCWLFMACTGLLLLEVCLWMEPDSNIISMAQRTLGQVGKAAAWILYLFLFYCLTLAYIVGCGDLVVELFGGLPEWAGSLIFVLLFSPIIYAGTRIAGRINIWLMAGLAISYSAFVILGFKHVKLELLSNRGWSYTIAALPIAFTAFAFQGIIPTLVAYMQRNVNSSRKAIIIGSFLPFVVYAIWQGLILGIVPTYGKDGLLEALQRGENAVQPLKNYLNNPQVFIIGQFFAFFALVTSFLGVTLGLQDFLADGLSIKKDVWGKFVLSLIIFLPPLLISFIHPGLFLMALDFAGGFGCALLLGALPILMVWAGRYHLKLKSNEMLPGGRIMLSILLLFVIFEITSQIYLLTR
jgi:tyrosine-specific transport protein